MGSRRTRRCPRANTTIAPASRSALIASKLTTISAAWSSGVIGSDERIRMKDGLLRRWNARSVPKSVSWETTILALVAARSRISSSAASTSRFHGPLLRRILSISTTPPLGATCWRRRETSRWASEWEFAFLHRFSGVLQCSGDVGGFEVGEVGKNLVGRPTGGELSDHRSDWDSQPSNTRRSAHLGRIDRDSFETHTKMIRLWSAPVTDLGRNPLSQNELRPDVSEGGLEPPRT